MSLEFTGLIVAAIWLLAISLLLVRIYLHYRKLTYEVKKGSLIKVLDKVIENEAKNAGERGVRFDEPPKPQRIVGWMPLKLPIASLDCITTPRQTAFIRPKAAPRKTVGLDRDSPVIPC